MTNFVFFFDETLKIPAQEFKSHSGVTQSSFAFTIFWRVGGWGGAGIGGQSGQ